MAYSKSEATCYCSWITCSGLNGGENTWHFPPTWRLGSWHVVSQRNVTASRDGVLALWHEMQTHTAAVRNVVFHAVICYDCAGTWQPIRWPLQASTAGKYRRLLQIPKKDCAFTWTKTSRKIMLLSFWHRIMTQIQENRRKLFFSPIIHHVRKSRPSFAKKLSGMEICFRSTEV